MKILTSSQLGESKLFYHTLKTEIPIQSHEMEGGKGFITVWCMDDIKAGDLISYHHLEPYARVEAIIERRNHRGIFDKPEKNINSFWGLKISFVRRGAVKPEDYDK